MSNVNLIERSDLKTILLSATSQTMISVVAVTDPSLRAKSADAVPNPYRIGKGKTAETTISKIIKINGLACPNYDRLVINRHKKAIIAERLALGLPTLDAEALTAEAAARPSFGTSWHRAIRNADGEATTLCCHRDAEDDTEAEAYLRFVLLSKGNAEYRSKATAEAVSSESVAPFLASSSDYSNQRLAEGDEVMCLTYSLRSVVEIAIDGTRYRIVDNIADHGTRMQEAITAVADEYLHGMRRLATV